MEFTQEQAEYAADRHKQFLKRHPGLTEYLLAESAELLASYAQADHATCVRFEAGRFPWVSNRVHNMLPYDELFGPDGWPVGVPDDLKPALSDALKRKLRHEPTRWWTWTADRWHRESATAELQERLRRRLVPEGRIRLYVRFRQILLSCPQPPRWVLQWAEEVLKPKKPATPS